MLVDRHEIRQLVSRRWDAGTPARRTPARTHRAAGLRICGRAGAGRDRGRDHRIDLVRRVAGRVYMSYNIAASTLRVASLNGANGASPPRDVRTGATGRFNSDWTAFPHCSRRAATADAESRRAACTPVAPPPASGDMPASPPLPASGLVPPLPASGSAPPLPTERPPWHAAASKPAAATATAVLPYVLHLPSYCRTEPDIYEVN